MNFISIVKRIYELNFVIRWVYFVIFYVMLFCLSVDPRYSIVPSFIYILYCFVFNFLFLFYLPRMSIRSIRFVFSVCANIAGVNSCILLLLLCLHYISILRLKYINIESDNLIQLFPYEGFFSYFMLLNGTSHIIFQLFIRMLVLVFVDFVLNFILVSVVFYLNYLYSLWLQYIHLMQLVELQYSFFDFLWYLARLAFVHQVHLLRSLFLMVFFIVLLMLYYYFIYIV